MDADFIAFAVLSVLVIAACFRLLWVLWQGPPYVPSHDQAIDEMVDLASVKEGERIAELGSGDGRLAIALAKTGAQVDGFEINGFLVRIARRNARKAGVTDRVTFTKANFWKEDLSKYEVITTFGIPHVMEKLGKKLQRECKPGTRIISNAFPIPGLKRTKRSTRAFTYIIT